MQHLDELRVLLYDIKSEYRSQHQRCLSKLAPFFAISQRDRLNVGSEKLGGETDTIIPALHRPCVGSNRTSRIKYVALAAIVLSKEMELTRDLNRESYRCVGIWCPVVYSAVEESWTFEVLARLVVAISSLNLVYDSFGLHLQFDCSIVCQVGRELKGVEPWGSILILIL